MNTTKFYLRAIFFLVALMFGLIFLTIFLTGGRDIAEFSTLDKRIFCGFLVSEFVTVFLLFYFAVKAGRMNKNKLPPLPQKTATDKVQNRRRFLLFVFSIFVLVGANLLGFYLVPHPSAAFQDSTEIVLSVFLLLVVLFGVFSFISSRRYEKRIKQRSVADTTQEFFSYRENVAQSATMKRAKLLRLIGYNDLLAILLALIAVGTSFLMGAAHLSDHAHFFCFAFYLLMAAVFRVRLMPPRTVFEDDDTYVTKADYPELYRIAENAQKALGHKGEIRIAIVPEMNAGIAKIGDVYSVQLGLFMLETMCEEELYTVLLHEFSHLVNTGKGERRIEDFLFWLQFGQLHNIFSSVSNLLFSYSDYIIDYEYAVYSFIYSICRETEADQAMAAYGSAEAAASSLLKLRYYEFYDWEQGSRSIPSTFAFEQPEKGEFARLLSDFRAQLSERQAEWNELAHRQILSRSASHPTIPMRLEALGISDYRLMEIVPGEAYQNDCRKALDWSEERIISVLSENYTNLRETEYLKPLRAVEAWEQAGKPVIEEEYSDMMTNLCKIGRSDEAEILCRRAIDTLSDSAACDAVFRLGCRLLYRYDDAGLPLIYQAIEGNSNYIEEGMEIIGNYCCLTGNQKELDIYRERAEILAQQSVDKGEEIGTLKRGDKISSEQLPEGMLESILHYIAEVDDGSIEKIYLVKKTISDTLSTSAFIVRFEKDADSDAAWEIMHKIFRHLDTCSNWQFSLFEYDDVKSVKPEQVEGSLVYSKK